MKASHAVEYPFAKAKEVLDSKELIYGDSYERNGLGDMLVQVKRKATGVVNMLQNGSYTTSQKERFDEDMIDLINFTALALYLKWKEEKS